MKKLSIKYNPYLLSTKIEVDGKLPMSNSKLNFGKLRIQEWAGKLPQILVDEYNDKNFSIEFTGTQTDYDDLKLALEAQKDYIAITSFTHHRTPDVSEVEDNVDEIFKEIMAGPVEQLRDSSIIKAFRKAKNLEFEINVVATMSSGKSTLINAILGKKLMPVANMATTATIVRIIDTEQENFLGIAYDSDGKEILREDNITYKIMKGWNDNTSISAIDIYGRIPCVSSVGMKLILVDTPGPNNSRDENHKKLTYQMLSDSDKSLVLFVMNGEQLNIDDEKDFMDYVCECMKTGGKQSRERYIFAVNKIDRYNPEEESISEPLEQAKSVLENRGIFEPNIFPVSAQVALECRTNPKIKMALPNYSQLLQISEEMRFDEYYSFNNLPHVVKLKIEQYLNDTESREEEIEIHSGIVSIEEAIGLYINKYARALKVKDLVDSFNNRLKELAAIATIQDNIRGNEEKKETLLDKIDALKELIESGRSAKVLSRLIDKKDLSKDVEKEVSLYISSTQTKINEIIYGYNNESQILKSKAIKQISVIEKESLEILSQLDARIEGILNKSFEVLYNDVIEEYKSYLDKIDIELGNNIFDLHPLDFVAENIANIDSLVTNSTERKDEGNYETKTKRESYLEKKTNWFWTPWNWRSKRYETKYRDKQVEEWVSKYVDYVDMSKVVSQYFQPLQAELIRAKEEAIEHSQKETKRIKEVLKDLLLEINAILEYKLNELQNSINDVNQTEEEIKRQKQNLKWMEDIIERVNQLINY